MNIQDLIDAIHKQNSNLKKVDIMSVLKLQGDVAQAALAHNDEVALHGIGKLKPVLKPARTGRSPATGEKIAIPARCAVKFVAAKAMKDAVA